MPDLLTHVLLTYAVVAPLCSRYDWLGPQHVTIAMTGAVIPDLNHIEMIIPSEIVSESLDVPFSWNALQTGGPVLAILLIGALLVERSERRRVFALSSLGAVSHLLLTY